MSNEEYKCEAARAALDFVPASCVIGVGTGSTVNHFISSLADLTHKIHGAVSSSEASTLRLKAAGIRVLALHEIGTLPLYVDGADEADHMLRLIKGGGGALTREKIVAAASDQFICIADQSKLVDQLGRFPLPVEIIPMARRLVTDELAQRGGRAVQRQGFTTDNGNIILDVHDLRISDPIAMETDLTCIPGVVTVGLFARRPADVLLLGGPGAVREIRVDDGRTG